MKRCLEDNIGRAFDHNILGKTDIKCPLSTELTPQSKAEHTGSFADRINLTLHEGTVGIKLGDQRPAVIQKPLG